MDALISFLPPSHPANAGNRQMIYHIGKYMQSVGCPFTSCTAHSRVFIEQYDQMRGGMVGLF